MSATPAPVAMSLRARLARARLSPSAWVGMFMLLVFVLVGVFGPWLAPYDVGVGAIDVDRAFAPPSAEHWLGTDKSGVDTLSQLLHGARSAIQISLVVVASCATIGVTLGLIAGYFGG